jgi:hypothetical protein
VDGQGSEQLDHGAIDRIVDVASVVLISVAAVLTALCGYQSGRWSGQQTRLYSIANAGHIESAEDAARANSLTTIDVTVFLQYVNAVAAGNTHLADFLLHRFRPEMRAATNAWLATKPLTNNKAPSSPFVMPQYSLRSNAAAREAALRAAADFTAAEEATEHSDAFLLLTVIFAGVSFLAGISTKLLFPRHAIIVALGTVALIYGIVRLVELPFL